MYSNQYYQMYPQMQQIVRVNGENGARTFQMAPNSSALLLDENAPLVWFVQTDGAGYKTVKPYNISEYVPEPEPDLKALMERLSRLEERIYAEPNTSKNEQQTEHNAFRSDERGKGKPAGPV